MEMPIALNRKNALFGSLGYEHMEVTMTVGRIAL